MPAIQAMRSDALAMRSKDDIEEKIPSFYNSVNQSLGNTITKGQDNAEQLIETRFDAANKLVAEIKQKLDGQSGVTESAYAFVFKLANRFAQTVRDASGQTDATEIMRLATDLLIFNTQIQSMQEQFDAAAAVYAQWVIQAGYAGQGTFFDGPGLDVNGDVSRTFTHFLELGSVPDLSSGPPDPVSLTEDLNPPQDLVIYDHDTSNNQTDVVQVEIDGVDHQVYVSTSTGQTYVIYSETITGPPGSAQTVNLLNGTADLITDEYDMLVHYEGPDPSSSGSLGTVDLPGSPLVPAGDPDYPAGSVTTNVTQIMEYTGTGPVLSSVTVASPNSMTFTGVGTSDTGGVPTDLAPYDPPGTPTTANVQIGTGDDAQTVTLMTSAANPGSFFIAYNQEINGAPLATGVNVPELQVTVTRKPDEFYREGPLTPGGVRETFTLPDDTARTDMYAMGGRGAIRYRDALTPRWTDRNVFGGSQLYDTWYGWGSVGSITRIGQERN